jgi:Signal peptidase, peptidase S26
MLLAALFVVLFVTSIAYRVPSSAMEPTLHCARPGVGCEANRMDRVLVSRFSYHIRDPHRGDVAAFHVPASVVAACGGIGSAGAVYLKRIVALPGERGASRTATSMSTAGGSTSPTSNRSGVTRRRFRRRRFRTTSTCCWATTGRARVIRVAGGPFHATT